MIADEREKAHAITTQVKLALVAHDPAAYLSVLFGEPEVNQPERIVDDEFDPTDTAGEWKFKQQEVDPADAERILAEMLSDSGGTMGTKDMREWR